MINLLKQVVVYGPKLVIQFLPNLVKNYSNKPIQNTSEGIIVIVSAISFLLDHFKLLSLDQFNQTVGPLLTYYVLPRVISKGVS